MSYAQLDFSKKTEVLGNEDVLDAIGAGINMLGEELENSTVSLKEKEQLLKEVHHRVKNNLQIVSSLLNLQSDNILDEKYLAIIKDSRNRINSMAIVHEMLYASRDLSKIEIKQYIERLCESIHQSFSRPGSEINFKFKIDQNLYFEIDHMIPLGLIINEVVSNSFKYAFPTNKGEISIKLHSENNEFKLDLSDNGIGLLENFDPSRDGQLGMQLIIMLVEQMEAKVAIDQKNGTAFYITFKI
ncbi:sensor histidine kinase [Aurantibacillus circumpalustris]|uniref:sensor histidine kinase n=1 Tax=Aurantibacillus circumpalustris TaxID=3036359 RepID=UPI00295C0A15|nr:sensor histidine kinase [Aurantibacillus circumpalustris]